MMKKAIIAKSGRTFFETKQKTIGTVFRFSMSIAGATNEKPVSGHRVSHESRGSHLKEIIKDLKDVSRSWNKGAGHS